MKMQIKYYERQNDQAKVNIQTVSELIRVLLSFSFVGGFILGIYLFQAYVGV